MPSYRLVCGARLRQVLKPSKQKVRAVPESQPKPDRCAHCQHPYPVELLCCSVIGGRRTKPICGLCARQLINEAHGWRKEGFKGQAAELNRLRALEHRQKIAVELSPSQC